jgi:exopolyphosphatase / guanosine-5'-triphosphate,3'-diphosphate pyrophosphatase
MDSEVRATGLDPARERAIGDHGPVAHDSRASDPRGRGSPIHPRADGAGMGTDLYGPTYAALDLGTNNCRLLVARATHEGFRVVDAFSRIIRLGEGITASGRLSDAAIARAIEALKICRDKMRNRGVTRSRLIATEACRSASNGAEFLAIVREQVGIELDVVDRETEALLAATGCTPLIDNDADGAILFDIGGGSSELVRLGRLAVSDRGPPPPQMRGWISLPVGVVTLAERHGGIVVTREIFEAMIAEVAGHIAPFAATREPHDQHRMHLLGTSGTVTTIAGVHLALKRYDRRRIDGAWMSDDEVTGIVNRLLGMNYDERAANACIGTERADLVLAGCAILEAIRRIFPCTRLRIADRGLREGLLVQMMRADGVWAESV